MPYSQSDGVVLNKPLGLVGKYSDARSGVYENYIYRDYVSTAEVLTWLSVPGDAQKTAEIRTGHFPIYVTSGGVTTVYYFKDGTADANLVPVNVSSGGGSDISAAGTNVFTGPSNTFNNLVNLPGILNTNSKLRVGNLEFQPFSIDNNMIGSNLYYNLGGTAYTFRSNGFGNMIQFAGGIINFYTADNGVAGVGGATATLTAQMMVTPAGVKILSMTGASDRYAGYNAAGQLITMPTPDGGASGDIRPVDNTFTGSTNTFDHQVLIGEGLKLNWLTASTKRRLEVSTTGAVTATDPAWGEGVVYLNASIGYTVLAADKYIFSLGSAAGFTLTMPDPVTCPGRVLKIRNGNTGLGTIALSRVVTAGTGVTRSNLYPDQSIEIVASTDKWLQIASNFTGTASSQLQVRTISASTTLLLTDDTVLVNDTASPITITLPAAASVPSKIYQIKKIGPGNTTTIDGAGTETIDGSLTRVISTQYNSLTIQSSGTAWFII